MRTPQFFLGLLVAFVILLTVSKYLMRALRYLVAADPGVPVSQTDVARDAVAVSDAAPDPVLSAAQGVPVSLFAAQRVTTAEILSPASVTEHTTNLLEDK